LENTGIEILLVFICELRDSDLKVEEFGFDSEFVEDVNFFGELLDKLRVAHTVIFVEPKLLEQVHNRSGEKSS